MLIPQALATVAAGRDVITTEEFAKALLRRPQTIRKNYSRDGSCFGIRPIKVGGFLLWQVSDVANLLIQRGADVR